MSISVTDFFAFECEQKGGSLFKNAAMQKLSVICTVMPYAFIYTILSGYMYNFSCF
jgi:hypothetical protein